MGLIYESAGTLFKGVVPDVYLLTGPRGLYENAPRRP